MSGKGIRLLGVPTLVALVAGGAVLGVGAARGPLLRWWAPDIAPTRPATVSSEADVALRSAVADAVPADGVRRPWRVEYGSVALPIAVVNQRGENWCWAATAASVAAYYGVSVSQCSLVRAGAPIASLLGGCPDVPATASQQVAALTSAGIPAVVLERPLTAAETRAQVDAGHPVIAHLAPVSGTVGHVVVIRGYDTAGGLLLADPRPDRRDAALAWHSLPSEGVPYDVLTGAPGALAGPVVTGHGADGTAVYREGTTWAETVLVAAPGEVPALVPAAVASRR